MAFIKKLKKGLVMPMWLTILAIILCAGGVTLLSLILQPGSLITSLRVLKAQPVLLIYNGLPPLLILLLFYFLIGNVFFSSAVAAGIVGTLSLVNRYKITFRDDPLVPRDVFLLREAFNSVNSFEIDLEIFPIILLVLSVLLCIALGIFFKSKHFSKIPLRLSGAVLSVLLFALSIFTIYSNNDIYNGLKVSSRYNITTVFNELGFNYNFMRNLTTYPVEKPDGYRESEVLQWINDGTGQEENLPEELPHIIFIMCEAFSDLSNEPVFGYTPENNPMKNFNRLKDSPQTISGNIYVSNFGAGTANTEFDILTGMQTNLIAPSSVNTSAFRTVRKNLSTIPRLLESTAGYQTNFMHPGESWFYNRSSVYKFFGVEDQTFRNDYILSDPNRGYSDSCVGENFITKFEEQRDTNPDSPVYSYIVTIQNHLPYPTDKNGAEPISELPLNIPISDSAAGMLKTYLGGVRDGDMLLSTLTDYFNKIHEPVVLVFYGDHRPSFGSDFSVYKDLGMNVGNEGSPEEALSAYRVPYIIWQNDYSAEKGDITQRMKNMSPSEYQSISSNFLGSMVMELCGFSGADQYIDYINEMRKTVPVIWGKYSVDTDGNFSDSLTDEQAKYLKKLRCWSYYRLTKESVS